EKSPVPLLVGTGRSIRVGSATLFVGVVGALVVAARKLRHAASVERAEAVLAAEIDTAAKEKH
ncbi:MAG TPA: hypothetical protein VM925_07470, partial [Labilithrix sp.]|nr:hypothetical protein [Labilithrix sp.]